MESPTSPSATAGGTSPRPWSNRGGEAGRDAAGTSDIDARRVSSRLITDGGALDAWCAPITRVGSSSKLLHRDSVTRTRELTSLLPSSSARTQAIARLRAARDAAATRIARAWRRHVPRARYRALRNLARAWSRVLHPSTMLRHSGAPNDAAMTSDVAAQTHVRLALIARCDGGDDAKPDAVLVYRVCTHGPVVDVGRRRRRRRSREDEETRNPWRPVEDDNGFLRSIVADGAVKKPSNAEIMETYTVRMSRKVPSVEERAAEMKRRARDRRRKVFGLVDNDDDEEEAPSDEEDLLAWSASLDFDSFQRTLVT